MSIGKDREWLGRVAHYIYICRKLNVCIITFLTLLPLAICVTIACFVGNYPVISALVPLFFWSVLFSVFQFMSTYDSYVFLKGFVDLKGHEGFPDLVEILQKLKQTTKAKLILIFIPPIFLLLYISFYIQLKELKGIYMNYCKEGDKGFDVENHLPNSIEVKQ